jgi:PAS domain-containing protein
MPETMMKMPALAVVGPDRRIVRSTETFRRRYEVAGNVCERSPELDQVLTGRADVAIINLGDLSVEIEAVTDATGRRQAMLTLPPDGPPPAAEPPLSALRDAAGDSPAIVWVKDLDGRYLFANARYAKDFGTSEERLRGNTDADLPETETVDGPRLRYAEDGLQEPLQLEYTVPAIEKRPALAAFRFALRDETGQPVATCGVAAPVAEAHVARDEAVRLMQLERWNRLDPIDVRAELLEQWHVQAAPAREAEPAAEDNEPPAAPPVEAIHVEEEEAPIVEPEATTPAAPEPPAPEPPAPEPEPVKPVSRPTEPTAAPPPAPSPTPAPAPAAHTVSETAELLQTDLHLARRWADRAEGLQGELQQAQARIRQSESDAHQAQAAAARAAEDAERWRGELEETRRELERAQAEAHAAHSEAEAARGEVGAARAQAESLRGPSTAALRLSEELGRAVAAERERGDELERVLARLRSRLTDFESALEHNPATVSTSF